MPPTTRYVDGLDEVGWRCDEREVRLAFAAACVLRTFSILSLDAVEMLRGRPRSPTSSSTSATRRGH
jgi:hypothetical protein